MTPIIIIITIMIIIPSHRLSRLFRIIQYRFTAQNLIGEGVRRPAWWGRYILFILYARVYRLSAVLYLNRYICANEVRGTSSSKGHGPEGCSRLHAFTRNDNRWWHSRWLETLDGGGGAAAAIPAELGSADRMWGRNVPAI